jgi:hypothetical protein
LGGDDLAGYSVGGVAVQALGFSDAEDLERAEAKVDDIKDRLGLPTPHPADAWLEAGYGRARFGYVR